MQVGTCVPKSKELYLMLLNSTHDSRGATNCKWAVPCWTQHNLTFYKNFSVDFILPHSSKEPNLGDQVSTCNSVFSTWKVVYIITKYDALLPMLALFQLLGRPPHVHAD